MGKFVTDTSPAAEIMKKAGMAQEVQPAPIAPEKEEAPRTPETPITPHTPITPEAATVRMSVTMIKEAAEYLRLMARVDGISVTKYIDALILADMQRRAKEALRAQEVLK